MFCYKKQADSDVFAHRYGNRIVLAFSLFFGEKVTRLKRGNFQGISKGIFITSLFYLWSLNLMAQPGSTDPGPGVGCSNGTTVYGKWVGYKNPYNSDPNGKQAYYSLTQSVYTINNVQKASCTETDRDGPNGIVPVPGSSPCIITNNYAANNITYAGGTLVYYKVGTIGCPLDDYVPVLTISISILGCIMIRKKTSILIA